MKNLNKKVIRLFTALAMTAVFLMISNVLSVKAEAVTPAEKIEIRSIVTDSSLSDNSGNMVPQGICVTPSYIFISAYDENNTKSPVIYVFTKSNKKYLGTLILPKQDSEGANHVGGLAYDGSNIWVSVGGKVGYFSAKKKVDTLKTRIANLNKNTMAISYDKVITVACQASTLGYDSSTKRLWVAKFDKEKENSAYSYTIGKDENGKATLSFYNRITVPRYTQGIAFKGDRMLISTSYGLNNAYIHVYNWDGSHYGKELDSYGIPRLSEGVVVDGNYVYVVFESPANKFYNDIKYLPFRVDYFAKYNCSSFGV